MSFWVTILEAWVPQLEIFHQMLRGCSHDKIALARVSYQDDALILCYVYMMMGHFISWLFECTLHVDKIHVWIKSETLCVCHPFQSTCRPIWHWNRWSFHVYMMPLWNFLPHSGTTTWMNSLQGDSQRHGILWWYYIHKCRAMKGNQSELRPAWKSPWCNVNTPLE